MTEGPATAEPIRSRKRPRLRLAKEAAWRRLVLVFDQFEELFTLGRAGPDQWLTELADLIENRAPAALEWRFEEAPELVEQFDFDRQDYRVLLCLREDYLPHWRACAA